MPDKECDEECIKNIMRAEDCSRERAIEACELWLSARREAKQEPAGGQEKE